MTTSMRPRRTVRLLAVPALLLLTTVTAAGCGSASSSGSSSSPSTAGSSTASSPSAASASASPSSALEGTRWVLAGYVGSDGQAQDVVGPPNDATLAFGEAGALAGSTGCNQIAGTYTESGSSLTITLGPMTLKACAAAVETQEQAVLANLPQVASYTQDSDGLKLLDASGSVLLNYLAGPSTLAGTSWVATGINNGKGAVESAEATGTVTAQFAVDGTLAGFGGCNTYSATYELSGTDAITLGPVAATSKACEPPASTVEQAYLAALDKVTNYELDGWSTLTLRDADGTVEVTYRAVDAE